MHPSGASVRRCPPRASSANAAAGGDASERGYHLYQLGLAYWDQGDEQAGLAKLREAKALGRQALGEELWCSLEEAMHPAAPEADSSG